MEKFLHKSASRGHADHGWLNSYHTFSFAGYYDPQRVHFGALRVLNDDTVDGGQGFGLHPHDNMEIISIPLEGSLRHKDSMGNATVIRKGDVQVMSAGTGVRHSEYNDDPAQPVKFLQIWVIPEKRDVKPRYGQISADPAQRENRLHLVVSPDGAEGSAWIHQKAWFYLSALDPGKSVSHKLHDPQNGLYLFILSGEVEAAGEKLGARDGLGITGTDSVSISATTRAELLLMEVPMLR